MSVNDETLNIEPTAELFQKKLRRLQLQNDSPEAEALFSRPEYQSALKQTPTNTWPYYYKELNAYVDTAKALSKTPSPAEPAASKKGPPVSPMILPPRVHLSGSSNGSSTSSNTPSKSSTSKKSTSPSKNTSKTDGQNWWSTFSLTHNHKS